jgi:hypothetical protein
MYGIEVPTPGDHPFDRDLGLHRVVHNKGMREFGDALVVFKDAAEFVRRVKVAAETEGHELIYLPVEYVPTKHSGEMGPFRKLAPYAYQQGFRLLTVNAIEQKALTLKLGSLADIAFGLDLSTHPAVGCDCSPSAM